MSVFLRVLEYYDGLLFLTTNRPGALDEAFKSRIHLTLYYPPLDFQQTMEIWQMNIDRMRKVENERCQGTDLQALQINEHEILRLAEEKFYEYKGKPRWNGRQIRNAIQIASSLAHFDARKDKIQPRLTIEHFKMIHIVTEDFDNFMQETVGKPDGELAFERGDRADHWSPEQLRAGEIQSYDPDASLSSGGRRIGGLASPGQRHPSVSGRRPSGIFDRSRNDPPNIRGLHFQAPESSNQRPSLGRPPSISFHNEPDLDFGHRERNAGKGHSNEQWSSDGTTEYFNGRERPGGIFGGRKHGHEESGPESQTWFKRRKGSDYEDEEISPS
jgi:hypothetical protein